MKHKKTMIFIINIAVYFIISLSMILTNLSFSTQAEEINDLNTGETLDFNKICNQGIETETHPPTPSSCCNIITPTMATDYTGNPLHRQLDFDGDTTEWLEEEQDVAMGNAYRLWEHHGGFWADAEKAPNTIPPYNDEDDLLCWAATCSNMLEWTGWGFVGGMENDNTDTFFSYYQDHTTDKGSLNEYGLEWWFNGYLHCPDPADWSEEDVEGGDFWSSSYNWEDYVLKSWDKPDIMANIDSWLHSGYPVGLSIYPVTPPGGHAITCWGFNYDPGATGNDRYLGVWVTDSDSHKHLTDPDDVIRYYMVEYWDNGTADAGDDYWYMPNYGSGWKISGVAALKPFPGATRPIADVGGPYIGDEGTSFLFDASGSTTFDGALHYRWDFDDDGTWDTGWSPTPSVELTWNDDFSGTVRLEVFDGRLRDVDITTINVLNVPPVADAGIDQTVHEGEIVSFSGSFTDPGISDTHTFEWDFGDGTTSSSNTLTPTHTFGDDGVYTVTLTVSDDDGGSSSDTLTVTVLNLDPTHTGIQGVTTVDENTAVTLSLTVTDPGSDDLTFTWEFEQGPTITNTYYNNGISADPDKSPGGTYPFTRTDTVTHTYGDNGLFTVTVTVKDDDGGETVATTTITVTNVAPILSGLPEIAWVNENEVRSLTCYVTDPGSDDLTVTWNFGDGTPEYTVPIYYNNGVSADPYPSPEINPTNIQVFIDHTYGDNGLFTVTVTVSDDDGGVESGTFDVRVDNVDPEIISAIDMEWPYPENPGYVLPIVHELSFTASAYDQGSDDLTFTWDWDDGNIDTYTYYNEGQDPDPYPSPEINPITAADTATHTYAEPGTYLVTLTVTDDDGGSVTTLTYEVIVLTIEEAKHHINDYIQNLDGSFFKGKANQRKNAFNNMFNALDHMLDNEAYWGMIQHLNNNIRSKCDGTVDGKKGDDWITDPDAQYHICAKIDDLTAYIATYL